MDIGKLLLVGGLGVGAYLVYRSQTPAAAASSAPGGILPAATAPPISNSSFNADTTQSLIAKAAGPNFTMGSVDEWDYYYNQVRNAKAPDPVEDWGFTQETRLNKMSLPEWMALAKSHGLAGIVKAGYGMGGLDRGPFLPSLAIMELQ